jgi:hypothetical protein
VERSEAEAIYDSGREACVGFLIGLAAGQRRLEERLRALEAKTATSSRNSSQPPSADVPKTRQQRRQEAREKAKELAGKDGQRRKAGGQTKHPAGEKLVTLKLTLRRAQAAKLANRHKLKTKVKLVFTRKRGKKLTKTVTVRFG